MTVKEFMEVLAKYPEDMEIGTRSDRGTYYIPQVEEEKAVDLSENEKSRPGRDRSEFAKSDIFEKDPNNRTILAIQDVF